MKLILVSSDDEVLDTAEFTREVWDNAQTSSRSALAMIQWLQAGDDAR